jgi:predicted RND superfamily exporter protein
LTLFCGTLVIHSNRIKANRNSLFWCIKHKTFIEDEPNNKKIKKNGITESIKSFFGLFNILKKIFKRFQLFYKFLLTKNFGKCLVGVIFVIYISFSTYNAFKIREGLDVTDLVTDKSYFKASFKENLAEFDSEVPVQLIIYEPVDYSSKEIRNKIRKILEDVRKLDGINPDFLINWMIVYHDELKELKKTKNPDLVLNKIVNSTSPFANDLVLGFNKKINKTQIIASRFYIKYNQTTFTSKDAVIMNTLIKYCQNTGFPIKAFSVRFKVKILFYFFKIN